MQQVCKNCDPFWKELQVERNKRIFNMHTYLIYIQYIAMYIATFLLCISIRSFISGINNQQWYGVNARWNFSINLYYSLELVNNTFHPYYGKR